MTPTTSEQFVVVVLGSRVWKDGVYGPFPTEKAAKKWARSQDLGDPLILPLGAPEGGAE